MPNPGSNLTNAIRGNAVERIFRQRVGAVRLLLPFFLIFHLVVLALYFFGPVRYGSEPAYALMIYVPLYLIAFWIGNKIASRYYVRSVILLPPPSVLVIFASIIILAFSIHSLISVPSLFGSYNLGEVYSAAGEARLEGDPLIEYLRMPFGIFFFGLQPVLLVYWNDLTRSARVLGVIGLFATLLIGVVNGINRPLFDCAAGVWILWLSGLWRPKLSLKWRFLGGCMALLALVSMAAYFTETQLTRPGSPLVSGYDSRTGTTLKYSGEDGRFLAFYSGISSYLTQGYRGFELALEEDWEPTYGLGNSIFLARQADRLLGTNVSDRTYPAKIEKHEWDRLINWATFYVWVASDVHFTGVVFVMMLFGALWRVVGNSVDNCRYGAGRAIIAVVFFYYLSFGLFYLSANNQLLQSGIGVFTSTALIVLFFGFGRLSRIRNRG